MVKGAREVCVPINHPKRTMDSLTLFNFDRVRNNRRYAASQMAGHDFLIDRAVIRLLDNLADIRRNFRDIAVIGSRGATSVRTYFEDGVITVFDIVDCGGVDVVMGTEIPSFDDQAYDCIIALPYLHTVNAVPQFLMTVKQALKPDGVFLCTFFGGQSLMELRQSVMQAEIGKCGGASQHIHPMIDHYQFAGLLQQAGFALPVVDFDRVNVGYENLDRLYEDLRAMGEGNALSDRPYGLDDLKTEIATYYKNNFYTDGYNATIDIIHGIGWAPHESQQQPARRGSGQISMTEVL